MTITEAQKKATYRYRKTEKGMLALARINEKRNAKWSELYNNDEEFRQAHIMTSCKAQYVNNTILYVKYLFDVPHTNRGRPSKYVNAC